MNLFKENAFLSEQGDQLVSDFKKSLADMLNTSQVKGLSKTQLQVLGSNLNKIVGDAINQSLIAGLEQKNSSK